jgi:hypothetical protein
MAKIKLENFKRHNLEEGKGGVGTESPIDIRETLEEKLGEFCKGLEDVRRGSIESSKGKKYKPRDVSFEKALKAKFGFENLAHFLRVFELDMQTDSLADLGKIFGQSVVTKATMNDMLVAHSDMSVMSNIGSFGTPANTKEIDSTFRFILPEIFTNAIRLGYEASQQSQKWIAKTINMSQRTLVMPLIFRGDGMPAKINEGGNIPVGSLSFGRKNVNVFKVGTGFDYTDELINDSALDMLYLFMGEVGNDMAIGADTQAINVLINGEQADGSESAPIVGVLNTTTGFTYADLKKVFTRMKRMNQPANRLITGEDDGIAITSIDRFEGFMGPTKLASISTIIGVPDQFENDVYVMPANEIMFLNPAKAMVKLQYRGLQMEKQRNPQNQTERMYVSDYLNFAIVKRDARVIQTKASTIGAAPFPAYMDIDTRISASYTSF